MRDALARHDAIVRDAVESRTAVTSSRPPATASTPRSRTASDAVDAAIAAQLALHAEDWPSTGPLRVRMGLHTGAAEVRDGDYYGTAVNRAARLMAMAHGGQIVVSLATERARPRRRLELVDLGEHRLRDLAAPGAHVPGRRTRPAAGVPAACSRWTSFPTNLPLQSTSFVGRDASVDGITALATRRVVTLTASAASARPVSRCRSAARCCRAIATAPGSASSARSATPTSCPSVIAATLGVPQRPD